MTLEAIPELDVGERAVVLVALTVLSSPGISSGKHMDPRG